VPGLSGGLNGSTQHFLEVYSQESENLKFVVGVDLSAALLCSDPTGNSRLGLCSSGSIVVGARWCFRSPKRISISTVLDTMIRNGSACGTHGIARPIYQQCVTQANSQQPWWLSPPPDPVKEMEKDANKPMRPNDPGFPNGGNMPSLPGKGPEKDIGQTFLDLYSDHRRNEVKTTCFQQNPLAGLSASWLGPLL
jgi:hypothetical protein